MNDVNALWGKTCDQLKAVLHNDVFSRWIAVIDPIELCEDDVLVLAVDNDFYQSWLEENYLSLIKSALGKVSGRPFTIRFTLKARGAVAEPAPPAKAAIKSIRDRLGAKRGRSSVETALNPRFKMDSFIVGPSNNFAHAAASAVAQAPARAYNPLFIYGGVGLGKTHLMQAIGHHVLATSRAHVCYLSSEALLNEYITALTTNSLTQYRKKYRSCDLLLIDDIHFLAGKERIQEEFFHTFNVLFDSHKQIVMTSDRPASEITGLEQRLVSRFEWGLVTELEAPDVETRIAILKHKQHDMQGVLPDELIVFIAEHVKSNIRRLEGALVRAVSYSSLMGKSLNVDDLRHLLKDTLDNEQSTELTFGMIQKAVADHYDIRLADMSSKRRPRSVAVPRQVAMYLCRRMTRSSLPDIGNAFGKTHATVLHAFRCVNSRMDVDAELKRDVSEIARKLGVPMACTGPAACSQ
jgi:chromosomal replication initiator protein